MMLLITPFTVPGGGTVPRGSASVDQRTRSSSNARPSIAPAVSASAAPCAVRLLSIGDVAAPVRFNPMSVGLCMVSLLMDRGRGQPLDLGPRRVLVIGSDELG